MPSLIRTTLKLIGRRQPLAGQRRVSQRLGGEDGMHRLYGLDLYDHAVVHEQVQGRASSSC